VVLGWLKGLMGGFFGTTAWVLLGVFSWFAISLPGESLLQRAWKHCRAAYLAERQRRQEAAESAVARVRTALAEWEALVTRYEAEQVRLRDALRKVRKRYLALQSEYLAERTQAELAWLERTRAERAAGAAGRVPDLAAQREQALEQFLRSRFIGEHKIPGIGPGRVVLLASYGIETAYDLTEAALAPIRGIGRVLTENLMGWKRRALAEFHFDPGAVLSAEERAAVPDAELRPVVLKYKQVEDSLRGQLQKGAGELETLDSYTEEQVRAIQGGLGGLAARARQAALDLQAAG
jgi:hypothetical protein